MARRRASLHGEDRHWVSNNVSASKWSLTGTTKDGHRLAVRGCDHYEFRVGRVVCKDSYWKIIE